MDLSARERENSGEKIVRDDSSETFRSALLSSIRQMRKFHPVNRLASNETGDEMRSLLSSSRQTACLATLRA